MPTSDKIPRLTAEQMRQVDRLMIEEYGISLLQMMENAGSNLAALAVEQFAPKSVAVLAGSGGNGGGGLVAARHLANRGCRVTVTLATEESRLGDVPAHQCAILKRMGIPMSREPVDADLVIDALIGYSLQGEPRGRIAELIDGANGCGKPILSLDCPSGLDVTTGEIYNPCIKATTTMTLALPKKGLDNAPNVGQLYLADISVPPQLYSHLGIDVSQQLFATSSVIPLR